MTTDLRDLLELASDDVPEADLAEGAWRAARAEQRAVRRRVLLGAGAAAAAAAVTTVVLREAGEAGPPAGSPSASPAPSPTRLRTADVGGVTVHLAPPPGDESALPAYADAAVVGLGARIGFTDAMQLPGLGPETGRPANSASVRAVLLARLPERGLLMPVLHVPRADGDRYLACPEVRLHPADPTETGQGMVLHPRAIRDDRLAVVFPQPSAVVVLDARTGVGRRIPVGDPGIRSAGWAKDGRTVVVHGAQADWLVDTETLAVTRAGDAVGAGWVDLVTTGEGSALRTFSAAGTLTGVRPLRGPVVEVDGPTVSNTEAWGAAHAYLGQTYAGAIGRSQGLLAVQGDLRPIPRLLAATRGPDVPKGCYRPLAFGPRDVVVLESRSFPGGADRPTLRLLAWDVIEGGLSFVGEVGPVLPSVGGFTGAYAL
ncbi:hypothetical protein ACK8HX_16320 [Oryzobacter sp. R7]|uniref:hypothetical protein n=1 Tax=Oryzobacter faecalis TaxID=3388656 RepID=UPI00398CB6FD